MTRQIAKKLPLLEGEAPSNNDDIEVKLFARLEPSHVEREREDNQHKSVQRLLEEGCVSTMAHADTQKYAHLQTQTQTHRHKDTKTHRQTHRHTDRTTDK